MLYKKMLCVLVALQFVALAAGAAPTLINHEEVIEGAARVVLRLNDNLHGVALVYPCDSCSPLRLFVTPATVVLEDGARRSLAKGHDFGAANIDVFYLVKEKRVTRFHPWR